MYLPNLVTSLLERVWLFLLMLGVALFLGVAGPCATCSAQALELELEECAPSLTSNRRALLTNEGATGMWFHSEVANCIAARLRLLPDLVVHVSLLEDRLELAAQGDELRERQVGLAVEEAMVAQNALTAAIRRARAAEEDRDAWFRQPLLWVSVGVVVTIAAVVAAALLLKEVSR